MRPGSLKKLSQQSTSLTTNNTGRRRAPRATSGHDAGPREPASQDLFNQAEAPEEPKAPRPAVETLRAADRARVFRALEALEEGHLLAARDQLLELLGRAPSEAPEKLRALAEQPEATGAPTAVEDLRWTVRQMRTLLVDAHGKLSDVKPARLTQADQTRMVEARTSIAAARQLADDSAPEAMAAAAVVDEAPRATKARASLSENGSAGETGAEPEGYDCEAVSRAPLRWHCDRPDGHAGEHEATRNGRTERWSGDGAATEGEPEERRRCAALSPCGTQQCKKRAEPGSEYCKGHWRSPEEEAEARADAERAHGSANAAPAQHTPGPWEVRVNKDLRQVYVRADGAGVIATTGWTGDAKVDEQSALADATLMAAAPEMFSMLAALQQRLMNVASGMEMAPKEVAGWVESMGALLGKAQVQP